MMILKVFSIFIMLVLSNNIYAQYDRQIRDALTTYQSEENKVTEQNGRNTSSKVYDIAEQMPSFKGNVNQWISANLTYPETAAVNGIQGRVIVNFIVEADGSVSNPEIWRSVSPELDREAINLVKRMPKWNPGMSNGKPARVRFTLPITFKLQ